MPSCSLLEIDHVTLGVVSSSSSSQGVHVDSVYALSRNLICPPYLLRDCNMLDLVPFSVLSQVTIEVSGGAGYAATKHRLKVPTIAKKIADVQIMSMFIRSVGLEVKTGLVWSGLRSQMGLTMMSCGAERQIRIAFRHFVDINPQFISFSHTSPFNGVSVFLAIRSFV